MSNEMLVTLTVDQLKTLVFETLEEYHANTELESQDSDVFVRNDYITRREVEECLGKSYSTVSGYISDGLLKPHKYLNNSHLFKKSEIERTFPDCRL